MEMHLIFTGKELGRKGVASSEAMRINDPGDLAISLDAIQNALMTARREHPEAYGQFEDEFTEFNDVLEDCKRQAGKMAGLF